MKERPIIFNSEMVRAILDGRKTQTRRVVTKSSASILSLLEHYPHKNYSLHCSLGQPGDRLWVRETWMPDAPRDGTWGDVEFYGCKGSPLSMIPLRYRTPEHCIYRAGWDGHEMVGWTPSIHMPRWASRITLEITAVRVERLNDISDVDATAEGCSTTDMKSGDCLADVFARLWSSIYGTDSWGANPWVWVIEFKRVEASND
ncbi:Uncharacterised protein [Serratia rubidaea]|nr:Uncharacterised protein [Serratia rubidaea]